MGFRAGEVMQAHCEHFDEHLFPPFGYGLGEFAIVWGVVECADDCGFH